MSAEKPESAMPSVQSSSKTKWRTQMVCLKAKKKPAENQSGGDSEIKLLEIISNCQWEVDRANMLSKISHIISKESASKSNVVLWNNYALQFLPKADKPAVIPPELKSKLPDSMYSIRVRVTQNLNDIEQADDDPGKDGSEDNLGDENIKSLSDKDKQQYASLRVQKKLIDKIRFAEKLKDLIEQEEKKGTASSKFSISKDGIEKALKRYKTQLWRAYTGNSNMSLAQLREAVMKAKSSNYTEKIDQAINAIEKKASETNVQSVSVSTFSTTSLTDSSVPKMSYDLKTLSSSAMARIEANQGIVIKGNVPFSRPPVSRLLPQGGNQSDVFVIPVTSEEGESLANLPTKLNIMSYEGMSNVVNLQPVAASSTTFQINATESEIVSSSCSSNSIITSTSSSAVASTAAPKTSVSVASPSVVSTLGKPVMSSFGAPRPFKPVSTTAGSTAIRMPVALSNGQSGSLVVSPVTNISSPGAQPMLLGGMINGQQVFLQASQSGVQPTAAKKLNLTGTSQSSPSNPSVIPFVPKDIISSSENIVHPSSEDGIVKVPQTQPFSKQVTMSSICINGPGTGFYQSVRIVTENSGTVPTKYPLINSSHLRPTGKSLISPQTLSVPGTRHMIPVRMLNPPPNTPGAIVQLIPVTSASMDNSSNGTFQSIPAAKPRLIAVPIRFEKHGPNNTAVTQTQGICVNTSHTGIKTCPTTIHRPFSPATGFIPVCSITSSEASGIIVNQTAKSPVEKVNDTELVVPLSQDDSNRNTADNADNNENLSQKRKKKKKKKNNSVVDTENVNESEAQLKELSKKKKRKKSYAEKLADLNKTDTGKSLDKTQTKCAYINNLEFKNNSSDAKLNEDIDGKLNINKNSSVTNGKTKSVKLFKNLGCDITDITKSIGDDTADISQSINDAIKLGDCTDPPGHEVSVHGDSVDGDSGFNHSPRTVSESGDSATLNIDKVIDNTTNAGLQIASVLGNTLDSPVIATTGKAVLSSIKPVNVNSSEKDKVVVENAESENVIEQDTSNSNSESQDSDGCLIIDETYKSPSKYKISEDVSDLKVESNKRQIEDDAEDDGANKKFRSSSPGYFYQDLLQGKKVSKRKSGSTKVSQIFMIEDSEVGI